MVYINTRIEVEFWHSYLSRSKAINVFARLLSAFLHNASIISLKNVTDSPLFCDLSPNKIRLRQLHLIPIVTSGTFKRKCKECFHNSCIRRQI